jgi:hypothetical protein
MKALLVVLLESFVLTVFITLMSQAYVHKVPSMKCRTGGIFSFNKCIHKIEALRESM